MQATAEQLAILNIFAQLDPQALEPLVDASLVQGYQRGDILIHEGDRFPPKLHAILDGRLLVQKIAASGKETTLRQLSAGEMFAAPALFGDSIAPATVTALRDTRIVTIDKAALLSAIQSTPEIALQILQCFNQRLQEMHQTIHGLISERAVVRLARLILYTADRYGTELTEAGARLNTKLPHQQMARMVGITYEESVRMIKKDLHTAIEYNRGGVIIIRDAAVLQSMAV